LCDFHWARSSTTPSSWLPLDPGGALLSEIPAFFIAGSRVATIHTIITSDQATSVLPLLASDAWHRGAWRNRAKRRFAKLFD